MTLTLAALGLAVPALLFALWPLWRTREAPEAAERGDDPVAALEAEKVQALRAIRDLEQDHQAGLLPADEYADQRARHEARATAILKRLDELKPARPPAAPRPKPAAAAPAPGAIPWTQRPAVLAGGALAVLAFGVVLGVLVVRYTSPTPSEPSGGGVSPMPGLVETPGAGTASAGIEGGGSGGAPIAPGVLQGMLGAAHQALDAGRYQEAIAAYKAILKREPQNVEAITHLGIILGIAGHAEGALEAFDRALAIDPNYIHALWDKARVLEERQDYAGALATWERFAALATAGQDRDQALARVKEIRTRLAATPPAKK